MINKSNNKGSVLLLTMMVSFLLSLIIAAGLTQSQTSMVSNNAFKQSNRALYLSMRGMHHGVNSIKENWDTPQDVEFNHTDFLSNDLKPTEYFRSAPLWIDPDNADPQYYVKPFTRYAPPHLPGASISSNSGFKVRAWHLHVSSGIKIGEVNSNNVYSRKGIETTVFLLSPK